MFIHKISNYQRPLNLSLRTKLIDQISLSDCGTIGDIIALGILHLAFHLAGNPGHVTGDQFRKISRYLVGISDSGILGVSWC